jgi:hypothetical protein
MCLILITEFSCSHRSEAGISFCPVYAMHVDTLDDQFTEHLKPSIIDPDIKSEPKLDEDPHDSNLSRFQSRYTLQPHHCYKTRSTSTSVVASTNDVSNANPSSDLDISLADHQIFKQLSKANTPCGDAKCRVRMGAIRRERRRQAKRGRDTVEELLTRWKKAEGRFFRWIEGLDGQNS